MDCVILNFPPHRMRDVIHGVAITLTFDGRIPERGSAGAVGYDLFSSADTLVPARCAAKFRLFLNCSCT